jgi:lipopolysaccharide biosynthesis regulator YciM
VPLISSLDLPMGARWPVPTLRRCFWGVLHSSRNGWAQGRQVGHRLPAASPRLPPQRDSLLLVRGMAGAAGGTKSKQVYRCTQCGEESLQWTGSCRSCKSFNT